MTSQDSQTAAKSAADTVLCKMGCGFFALKGATGTSHMDGVYGGSGATGDCCSKCWLSAQKKQGVTQSGQQYCVEVAKPMEVSPREEPTPMDIEDTKQIEASEEGNQTTPKKRKKKKASYKDMMAAMTKPQSPSPDIEKEKESLRKVVGGGVFQKIEKI